MNRGILTLVWGRRDVLPIERLLASTRKYHPELPHEVLEIEARWDGPKGLQEKSRMLELSPFDETLFLDGDTVVMDRLDYGFDMARRHALALCICESPWARRYPKLFSGDEVEYNTGVMFFTKAARPVFETWTEIAGILDSRLEFIQGQQPATMVSNDQGTFAAAIQRSAFNPYVLPFNWNFRPQWHKSFFGPVKIWHDYSEPPAALDQLNRYYRKKGHIIQYHRLP
jgi:hypothetical protein